jgi:hypothetical protein
MNDGTLLAFVKLKPKPSTTNKPMNFQIWRRAMNFNFVIVLMILFDKMLPRQRPAGSFESLVPGR